MGSPTSPLTPRTYPRTLVIMPAWNEEEALPGTITELQETVPFVDLVVVNDGSTDNTSAVAREAGGFWGCRGAHPKGWLSPGLRG